LLTLGYQIFMAWVATNPGPVPSVRSEAVVEPPFAGGHPSSDPLLGETTK
jgi:hypothetical protein